MKLRDLAERVGATLEGDGEAEITGVAGLREARPGEISFVARASYAAAAGHTRASALFVPPNWSGTAPCALLRVADPEAAIARAAEWLTPPPYRPSPGIHPTAVVARDVRLGEQVAVGAHCVIEAGATIGDRTVLFPGCYIGPGAVIGPDCLLHAHVSIRERCRIGARTILHNGVVVGSDGFGYTADAAGVRRKIPQLGIVEIGDDVEIGANTTIDRARFGRTIIGNGVKVDNLVQIAHNVIIGDHAVIVAQAGIAGSAEIGARAVLAGQAGIAGHLTIGEGAVVGPQAGVTRDVPPGAQVLGSPAAPMMEFLKAQAYTLKLAEFRQRLALLEQRVKKLEGGGTAPAADKAP